ncbi:MAG: gas vesicle protein K [Thaumarchaeota archaeon]|nr:gas vesicle protein K [Nitrososphaerota archaeon]
MQISKTKTETVSTPQISLEGDKVQKGLAKLVLLIVELLRQILERQAQRRITSGSLTSDEIERLGLAFMQIKEKMNYITEQFDLKPEELEGALNTMLKPADSQISKASLADVIDRLLSKGVMIGGRITVSVADIDLIALDLLATLSATKGRD